MYTEEITNIYLQDFIINQQIINYTCISTPPIPGNRRKVYLMGYLLDAKKICSENKYFEKEAQHILSKLAERKYPTHLLGETYNNVSKMNRLKLLSNSQK